MDTSIMPTPPVAARKRKRAHQYTVNYSEVRKSIVMADFGKSS